MRVVDLWCRRISPPRGEIREKVNPHSSEKIEISAERSCSRDFVAKVVELGLPIVHLAWARFSGLAWVRGIFGLALALLLDRTKEVDNQLYLWAL